MVTMATETMIHQRNLESSILFMQQEHAKTLKALHEEIAKLQKRCSELTFDLAMQLPSDTKAADIDTKRISKLEQELSNKRRDNDSVQQDLEKKEKRMRMLEQQLRAQEKKFLDEIRGKNLTINKLKEELESKSNNIAYLTGEMCKLRQRQRHGQVDATLTDPSQSTAGTGIPLGTVPVPPSTGVPAKARRSQQHRHDIHTPGTAVAVPLGTRSLRMSSSRVRIASGKTSARQTDSATDLPDATVFLERSIPVNPHVRVKPVPTPLPPISAAAVAVTTNASLQHIHTATAAATSPMVIRSATMTSRHSLDSISPPEVETLAVDQLSIKDSKWRAAHQSKSTEYK